MKKLHCLMLILIMLISITALTLISAEELEYEITKYEAEDNVGNFAVGEHEEASGGKYIGIDYTLNGEGFYQYNIRYENVPETTTLSINYASPHGGEVIIYVENDEGNQEVVGSIIYDATGGWDPFGESLGQVVELIYLPEGSTVTFITTSTFNVDYIEFMFNETEVPKPKDGKQAEGVAEKNNVFLSDLEFLRETRVVRDMTYTFGEPSIVGNAYSKGLVMSAGHFPGSEFVEVNIEGLGFTTFASYIGVDDTTNDAFGFGREVSVKFYVEVDGELKYESDVMTLGDDPVLVTVDVKDAKILKLYTSPVDDGIGTDICVWGNAALGKTSNIGEIFATPIPTPSPTPSPEPSADNTPSETDKEDLVSPKDDFNYVYIIVIVAILVIAAIAVFIIIKKGKNKGKVS